MSGARCEDGHVGKVPQRLDVHLMRGFLDDRVVLYIRTVMRKPAKTSDLSPVDMLILYSLVT